jgi:hypothetical protein
MNPTDIPWPVDYILVFPPETEASPDDLALAFALSASPLWQLTFPFAFEAAGETFWRSALRGDQVQPTYFERERN